MSTRGRRLARVVGWIVGSICVVVIAVILFVQFRWDKKDPRSAPTLSAPRDSATIARGEYIYKYQAQCWGCHQSSPSDPNAPPNGGQLFDLTHVGPGFGKWYSRNLTSDVETGLGAWTDGEIVQAIREGVTRDRTTLFPIMPVEWYHGMADDDALAVVAYLRTIPPVRNAAPQHEPSFVAKALFAFGVLAPKQQVSTPILAPPRGVSAEYGRYVSQNLGDCADCHSSRDLQDGHFFPDSLFAGSSFQFGGGVEDPLLAFAPNITPEHETGIGAWTEEQFLTAVTSGVRPDGRVLAPHMPYAYYKSWTPEDLKAVFVYLKTVPARRKSVPGPRFDPQVALGQGADHGKLLFRSRCQACHGKNGSGAQPTSVTLADVSASLSDQDLKDFIASGQPNLKMPSFGKTLSDAEMNDLIAFIRTWEKK